MEQFIEYGRDALLLALIAILAYILYKRLVATLSKDKLNTTNYAAINQIYLNHNKLTVDFYNPTKGEISLDVIAPDQSISLIAKQSFDPGHHQIESEVNLTKGQVTIRLVSENQRTERFFNL
jgi:hypothetical protein